jgi:hypothetical protein
MRVPATLSVPVLSGSEFHGFAGKDGELIWSTGARIIYDFRL